MEKNQNLVYKFQRWYRALPDKKRYIEFITALLTVPVLMTVLYANIQNFQKKPEVSTTPTQVPPVINIISPTSGSSSAKTNPTPTSQECKKTVGPMTIESPRENDIVTADPVSVIASSREDGYCAIVWSYRINGGSWSDYTDKAIYLYGLSSGKKELEMRIKSVISGDQILLTRTFTVSHESISSPTPTSTSSATPME